ncbi:hypothetical protein SUGI_1001140 [Cryptomeria japonica]|uniref:cytochrome P450 94B3 n=1 Tax=Cryptomeria japonica TaxID=3369 RepID=UPI002414693B|nr:cytochrome P450 94B3 [Cryptomeria japonica]GLJ47436.1 hypothetical protein SUGI_1001140 [Cryptomeria japonica]
MEIGLFAGFYLLMVFFLCVLMFLHGEWGFCCSRKRRRVVHGPRSYPFVGSLFSFWKNAPRQMDWYTEMMARSPTQTIVVERLGGVKTVVTASPANVEHIARTQFENYPKGEPFTAILHDLLGRGIFNADGDSWKLQRKIASYEFNTRSLRNFVVDVVGDATSRLIDIMDGYAMQERPAAAAARLLDMQDVLQRLAFDNICKVAFGVETGFLDASFPASELAQAFDLATTLSSLRNTEPISVIWKLKRLLNVGSERRLSDAVRVVHGFALDVVRSRMQESGADEKIKFSNQNQNQDLLSRFMEAVDCRGGNDGSEKFLRDIIVSFILAGRDTTSSALSWFFWLISSHRSVEDAIYNEIMATGGSGSGSGTFSYEDLKNMKYLHAAICESMRLYPPVPINSRHALHDDKLPDGTMVGKGTRVTYHSYAMGRMPAIWGPDCLQFKPERWLDDGGCFVPQGQFKYPVFHGGMRVCLGKEMAFIQMKYVAASVIRRFRVRPVGCGISPRLVHSLTSRMAGGFPVSIMPRNHHHHPSSTSTPESC